MLLPYTTPVCGHLGLSQVVRFGTPGRLGRLRCFARGGRVGRGATGVGVQESEGEQQSARSSLWFAMWSRNSSQTAVIGAALSVVAGAAPGGLISRCLGITPGEPSRCRAVAKTAASPFHDITTDTLPAWRSGGGRVQRRVKRRTGPCLARTPRPAEAGCLAGCSRRRSPERIGWG